MLTELRLTNIKRFDRLRLSLSPLTLLSGMNGAGKSTIIQSLLLLRQWYETGSPNLGAPVGGDCSGVDAPQDLLHAAATSDEMGVGISDEGYSCEWRFGLSLGKSRPPVVAARRCERSRNEIALFSDRFGHVDADRPGPRGTYGTSYHGTSYHREEERPGVGVRSEDTLQALPATGDLRILRNRRDSSARADSLASSAEAWLSEIAPGVRIRVSDCGDASRARLEVSQSAGAGIRHVLPVVIALLKAGPEHLVLLENPEAYLHPTGQVKLGELIARRVADGAQVILETHSDHVLNGIRLAVKRGRIQPADAGLYYFRTDLDRRYFDNPQLDREGRLSFWPEGFFDSWDNAIDALF